MNLNAVVGVLVAVFAAKTFCKRGKGVGKTAVVLHLGAFVLVELAFAGNVLIDFVHIHETGGFIEQCT